MGKCAICLKKYVRGAGPLFKVPRDEHKRLSWEESCGIQLRVQDYICADHFSADVMKCHGKTAMLLPRALPFAPLPNISLLDHHYCSPAVKPSSNSIPQPSKRVAPDNSDDVNNDWRHWCRLCAKFDKQFINIVEYTNKSIAEEIQTHFNVKIVMSDQISVEICTACFTLITSLMKFGERVKRVQEMYADAQASVYIYEDDDNDYHTMRVADIPALRSKYNILEEDEPHAFIYRSIAEINLVESRKLDLHDEEEYDAACTIAASNDADKIKTEKPLGTKTIRRSGEVVQDSSVNQNNSSCDVCSGSIDLAHNDDGNELFDEGKETNEDNEHYPETELKYYYNDTGKILVDETKEEQLSESELKGYKDNIVKILTEEGKGERLSESEFKDYKNNIVKILTDEEIEELLSKSKLKYYYNGIGKILADEEIEEHLSESEFKLYKNNIGKILADEDVEQQRSECELKGYNKVIAEQDIPYICCECGEDFKHFANYRLHMAHEHNITNVVSRHFCSICSLSFNTEIKLRQHNNNKHVPKDERRIWQCPQCELKCISKWTLRTHVRFVHMQVRPFICEECGLGWRSRTELKRHMQTHSDIAQFQCGECKKCYKDGLTLMRHLEIHDPQKHLCPECGLQLNTTTTFRNHLKLHSDATPYKCDYCGKAFKQSKYLKTHLLLHTGLRPYKCTFCDMNFTNASVLRTHKKKKHPEELAAFEATGGKAYTKDVPKLKFLKSLTKAADHLLPIKRGANRKPEGSRRRRGKRMLNE